MLDSIVIDTKILIESGLSLESYFILDCIHKDKKLMLEQYIQSCRKGIKLDLSELKALGYIISLKIENSTFNDLKLTQNGINLFGSNILDHKRYFQELKDTYPKRVKVGKGYRSLHQNQANIEKKYKDIITSEELHNNIIKCVKLYIKELTDANRLDYIQMLSTWINEKNYELYMELINNTEDIIANDDYDVI